MAQFKLNALREEAQIEPFELEMDDGKIVVIPAPDADTMMVVGETPLFKSRELLKLLLGEQHDEVWDQLKNEQSGVAAAVVSAMVKHFKLHQGNGVPGGFGASLLS